MNKNTENINEIKKLLENIDKDIFTEDIQDNILNLITEKIEVYSNKTKEQLIESIDEEHADKLKQVIESIDEDHAEKLESLIESIDEDHAEKLESVIESIDKDHAEKLENILESIDEDHTEKLESLIESIDEDHAEKLENILESIDEDHTEKLEKVKEFYTTDLVEKISNYLDEYIAESIPETEIVSESRIQKNENIIKELKNIFSSHSFDTSTITESADELLKIKEENIKLKERENKYEANCLLEELTSSMKPLKALFIKKYFKDSTKDEISEKIDEAVSAYETEELLENEKNLKRLSKDIKTSVVEIPDDDIITESVEIIDSQDSSMDRYVSIIENSIQNSRK